MESTRDWRQLASIIASSPKNQRIVFGGVRELEAFLSPFPRKPTRLLTADFAQVRRILAKISGAPIVVRSGGASVGDFAMPKAEQVPKLLRQGLLEIAQYTCREKDLILRSALWVLLMHPLKDGNGRLFRFVITAGLVSLKLSNEEIHLLFAELYRNHGIDFYQAAQSAAANSWEKYEQLMHAITWSGN